MSKIQFPGLVVLKAKRDRIGLSIRVLDGIISPHDIEELKEQYQELNGTIEYMEFLTEK